jgi:hypothetical protein
MQVRILGHLLLLGTLLAVQPTIGGPHDWTPSEIECAQSIGVDLRRITTSSSPTLVRHLSWIADAIVYGRVTEIRHDLHGAYHTIVALRVSAVEKGKIAVGQTIHIDLWSGPFYNPERDIMGGVRAVHEPSFSEGEVVCLFLTTDFAVHPDDPAAWAFNPGHFGLADDVKWLVDDDSVWQSDRPSDRQSRSWMDSEILTAMMAQITGCQ